MKLILSLIVFILVTTTISCKSRDKCGDCPKFSNVQNETANKQI